MLQLCLQLCSLLCCCCQCVLQYTASCSSVHRCKLTANVSVHAETCSTTSSIMTAACTTVAAHRFETSLLLRLWTSCLRAKAVVILATQRDPTMQMIMLDHYHCVLALAIVYHAHTCSSATRCSACAALVRHSAASASLSRTASTM